MIFLNPFMVVHWFAACVAIFDANKKQKLCYTLLSARVSQNFAWSLVKNSEIKGARFFTLSFLLVIG